MNPVDIAVVVVVCVAVAAVIGYFIYRKVRHKGGGCCDCGGSCSSCGVCPHCKTEENSKEK